MATMTALLLLAILTPGWEGDSGHPSLLVAAAPGTSMPALALVGYGGGTMAMVLFPGGKADAQALAAELRHHGVETLDAIFVPAYSPCHKGAPELVAEFKPEQIFLTDKTRSPADFSALHQAASDGGITLSHVMPQREDGANVWVAQRNGWEWRYQRWQSGSCRCTIRRVGEDADVWRLDAYATGEFTVTRRSKQSQSKKMLSLPRCSRLQTRDLTLQ